MSPDIVAVLVVPVVGWEGLYEVSETGEWAEVRHATHRHPAGSLALPLWWDGALVPEGWDRARRVLYTTGAAGPIYWTRSTVQRWASGQQRGVR